MDINFMLHNKLIQCRRYSSYYFIQKKNTHIHTMVGKASLSICRSKKRKKYERCTITPYKLHTIIKTVCCVFKLC